MSFSKAGQFAGEKPNYAPVWTIPQNYTAVPWKLKVPIQFHILKRKHHSKALRRSGEKNASCAVFTTYTKSTFLTILIPVAGTNSVSCGIIVEDSFFDKYFAEKLKVKRASQVLFTFLVEGFTQKKNLLFRKTASARHNIIWVSTAFHCKCE